MPLFVRKFIVDAIETGLAALFALTFVLPANATEGRELLLTVGAALAGALIAAARRAVPDFLAWLRELLGVSE